MSIFLKFKHFVDNPKDKILRTLNSHASCFSDELYLKIKFRLIVGHRLELKNPKGFCEKLQWLKLYARRPEYTSMVDKNLVKEYVSSKIGKKYIVPNLGVWDKPEEIDFSLLPNQFVLKTTHAAGSSGVIICKNKDSFDIVGAKQKLEQSLGCNNFIITREWPYKNVERKIIAEQYLEDESGQLRDYKVMCFDGEPKIIQVHMGRLNGVHTQDLYDTEWHLLSDLNQVGCVVSGMELKKPVCFDEMIECSRKLSQDIPHVRVDWYIVNGRLYFGELTFYDASGFEPFIPKERELEIGSWITLPNEKRI